MSGYRNSRSSAPALVRTACAMIGLVLACAVPLRLEAAYKDYSPPSIAILPVYCKYAQSFRENIEGANNPAEIARWYQVLGQTFHHLHHYCWGLQAMHDVTFNIRDKQRRQSMLITAVGEIDYAIQHAPPGYVLLPEFLFKKGECQVKLGQGHLAVLQFMRAIEAKPDYWPPYVALSDVYKDIGDLPKARDWLEKGLAAAPESKALRSRLAELGGAQGGRKPAPVPSGKPAARAPAEQPAAPETPEPSAAAPATPGTR